MIQCKDVSINMEHVNSIILNDYEKSLWDFGNGILYAMCSLHPYHSEDSIIIAKANTIGRVYAVQLERGKSGNDEQSEKFYEKIVTKAFKESEIDKKIQCLRRMMNPLASGENIIKILKVHGGLQSHFEKFPGVGLKRRSFCSKYLHFHLPSMFFIYDTRAVEAISEFKIKTNVFNDILKSDRNDIDSDYASFFCKCVILKRALEEKHDCVVTPRTIDNILLDVYDRKPKKSKQSVSSSSEIE